MSPVAWALTVGCRPVVDLRAVAAAEPSRQRLTFAMTSDRPGNGLINLSSHYFTK
jgi:hypothetical protein